MSHLVDTDWVADWLSGRPDAIVVLADFRRTGLAISTITYMETLEGIAGSPARYRAHQGFRAFLRGIRILVVSRAIAERAAEIRLDLRRQKRQVNERALDILVAATAMEHDLTLVTRNIRDYSDIAGLRLY